MWEQISRKPNGSLFCKLPSTVNISGTLGYSCQHLQAENNNSLQESDLDGYSVDLLH